MKAIKQAQILERIARKANCKTDVDLLHFEDGCANHGFIGKKRKGWAKIDGNDIIVYNARTAAVTISLADPDAHARVSKFFNG